MYIHIYLHGYSYITNSLTLTISSGNKNISGTINPRQALMVAIYGTTTATSNVSLLLVQQATCGIIIHTVTVMSYTWHDTCPETYHKVNVKFYQWYSKYH